MPSPEKQAAMEALCEAIAHRVSGSFPDDWPSQLMHDTSTTLLAIIEREKQPEERVYLRSPEDVLVHCTDPAFDPQTRTHTVTDTPKRETAEGRAGHCPRCDSPEPKLHPAMQFEGEVQPCTHPFHNTPEPKRDTAEGLAVRIVNDWLEAIEDCESRPTQGDKDRGRRLLALIRAERERRERAIRVLGRGDSRLCKSGCMCVPCQAHRILTEGAE